MEQAELRTRVVARALGAPQVVAPTVLGAVSAATALALGDPVGFFGFLGVTGLLLGIGLGVTRLTLRSGRLARQILQESLDAKEDAAFGAIDQLRHDLERVGDPRAVAVLDRLRALRQRLFEAQETASFEVPPEFAAMGEDLYRSCLASLERSVVLWNTSAQMATEAARKDLLAKRESLVDEVRRSVEQWAMTLDRLQAAPLQRDDEAERDLGRLREELSRELAVARRVEERLGTLERGLQGELERPL